MSTEKHEFKVNFLGQSVVLKSTEDPSIVEEVIALVEKKVEESSTRSKTPVPHQVALLALLDVAGEYVKAKHRVTEYKKEVDHKAGELMQLIEADFQDTSV